MTTTRTSALDEWRLHWPLVLAACVGFSFMSFMTPAAGVFMDPLGREFGWDRTRLSAGLALAAVVSILLSPFIGALIDRLGVRRVALPGLVATAAAIAAFGLASGSFVQWLALWFAWGVFVLFVQSTLWSTAVASRFVHGRGLALGITMSGTAVAQIVTAPLSNWLIAETGWRTAFVVLGLGWGGVAFVLSALFLTGSAPRKPSPTWQPKAVAAPGLTIAQAWRSAALWKVGIATFLILTATIAVVVHQFPILVAAGVSRSSAAWLVSLSGVAGVAGKLITGSLVDRFHARWIGGVTLASTALAWPLLMESIATPALVVVGMMISGYAAGTKMQLCSYLTAQYAGLRHYGAIFGAMTSMIALASAIGPLAAGLTYDAYGSYAPLLLAGVAISLVSGAIIFSLGAYPVWAERTPLAHD
ncbi:MAG TPA: MFS transporter [Novosphingobium sp.]|nr:MFS transporter [Novosphingobium sp.]